MGEAVAGLKPRASLCFDTPCGGLLRELETIWTEIGESEEDKDRMFHELEAECMRVYQLKVDKARGDRAQLHQSLVAKEAELAALMACLGGTTPQPKLDKSRASLKKQLASLLPLVDSLRAKREERVKQFIDVQSQIERITSEISGLDSRDESNASSHIVVEDHDLSVRKLAEYQARLQNLQKEKSKRLQKILEYVNEVHALCGVLGMDFGKAVSEVHPSLQSMNSNKSTNISDRTLEGLAQAVQKLKTEKKQRLQKLHGIVETLFKLWSLMESSDEDRLPFMKVTKVLGLSEGDVTSLGVLSMKTIDEAEAEVDRLTKLKTKRMRELVLKRRSELEEICRNAHAEPDSSTAQDKIVAMMDSGLVDPSELLASVEAQILKAKEDALTRKEILDRINKWQTACDEENWLEEYDKDENRYSTGRGSHLNLKRAEKARILVQKIPSMIDALINRTLAWETEKKSPFLYHGVRLIDIMEEYKLARLKKEEAKQHFRNQKKLQSLLMTEKELMFGSKPSPRKAASFNRRTSTPGSSGPGFMTPVPRRISAGSATPELLTPRSYSGRSNSYFRDTRRLPATQLNFTSKEDSFSSFASVSGSEPDSPLLLH